MNKISLLLYFITTMLAAQLHAQQKPALFATVQQGIWHDEEKIKIQPVVTGGVAWNSWSVGLSASIDFFYIQSIQAGVDLRRYFRIQNQQVFVYAVPGLNIVTPTKAEKENPNLWRIDRHFNSGYYFETGLGIMIGKKKNFFAAVAWSRKTFNEQYQDMVYNPATQKMETYNRKFDFEYNRIGMKLGVEF
jgi:hypothetical protein